MTRLESLEARRLCAFGTIDTNFGTGGTGSAPTIGGSDSGQAKALTVANGKTVVAVGGGLTRFNADGAVDTTFGTSGVTPFKRVFLVDAAADGSGRVYVLGTSSSRVVVQRYTAAGRLDSTYGTSGTVLLDNGTTFRPNAIDVQGDGKVVVAGANLGSGGTANYATRVYRLTTAAALDTSFDGDGIADFKLGVNDVLAPLTGDNVVDVRVVAGNKIEVLGSSYNFTEADTLTGNSFAALARLTPAGALDTGFGSGGVARRATFDNESLRNSVGTIRADGSAIVTTTQRGGNTGSPRTSFVNFAASGKASFNTYTPSRDGTFVPSDVLALADGRTAFVTDAGKLFTLDAAGTISNVVQPNVSETSGTDALATTADGDILIADVNSPYVRLTKVDAGKLTDPRVDNLPNAAVIDTAADAQGGLHVAYFDTATKSLKYAYRNAQGYWGGIRTVDATAGAGAAVSIDTIQLKDRTNVAIAYYDSSSGDLRIASSNTNGRKKFAITTIATKGLVGLSPSFHWTDAGGFAVTYYNKTTKGLYYSLYGDGKLTTEQVDSDAGEYSEFMFDPDTRRPGVAYSKSDGTVWYAFKGKGTTWEDARVKVATTAKGAAFVNLAIPLSVSSYGGPKVSYYDLSTADLVIATYDRYAAKKSRWTTHTVASRGVVGAYNDLTAQYYDATLYAYSRSGDGVFRYDYSTSSQTAVPTVLATGGGRYLSVATDPDDGVLVAVAYQDTATGLTFVR